MHVMVGHGKHERCFVDIDSVFEIMIYEVCIRREIN